MILPLALLGKLNAAEPSPLAHPARPNVILILADDLGYGDIGVHGCKEIPTPNIDRLATQGLRFTNAHCNGTICAPTRAALMTGLYQNRMGVEDLRKPLPVKFPTIPERLKACGYATAMVGKWHLGSSPGFTPPDRGFDEFFGFHGGVHSYIPPKDEDGDRKSPIIRGQNPVVEKRYLTDAFGEEATAFISRQRSAEKPFFLYLAFNAVHVPLQAVEKYSARFPDIRNPNRKTYAAMLSAMDDAIGKVLGELEAIGQADNTVVIFTNDNGGATTRGAPNSSCNAPLRGSKAETFEGGIRVPLLMRWPGVIKPDSVYAQAVCSFDLSATVLAAAGANSSGLDGVDLLPFLSGQKSGAPHETLFWRCRTLSNNYAALQGDWKYVHSTEGAEHPGPRQKPAKDMLFDLAEDIGEQHDLAAQYPEKLTELKKKYDLWSESVDADCRRAGLEPRFDDMTPKWLQERGGH